MSNSPPRPSSRPRRAIRMPGRTTDGDFEYFYYSPSSEFQDEQVEDMSVQETENVITNGGDVILNGDYGEDSIPLVENGDVVLAVPVPETKVHVESGGQAQGQNEDEIKSDLEFIDEVDFEGERKSFVTEVNRDHSYNSSRKKEKDCKCQECGVTFSTKGNLREHKNKKRCKGFKRREEEAHKAEADPHIMCDRCGQVQGDPSGRGRVFVDCYLEVAF